jgi:hypothetical protein
VRVPVWVHETRVVVAMSPRMALWKNSWFFIGMISDGLEKLVE